MRSILIALVLTITASAVGQTYTVTPTGMVSSADPTKAHLVVEVDGQTAKQLYDKAVQFLNETCRDAKDAIKGQTEGEYLKFETFASDFITYSNSGASVPISASFTTELRFKDGKVRYEIIRLEMYGMGGGRKFPLLFSGGLLEGYIVYRKNGKLFKEATKTDLESYFNGRVAALAQYLKNGGAKSDW